MEEELDPESRTIVHNALFEAIENQIKGNKPKETKETLDRLMKQGYDRRDGIRKIASVLLREIYEVETKQQPYNEKRYIKRLKKLK